MKVKDIIPDGNAYKKIMVASHLKKKKKANPKDSKTGPMTNFLDVFHGISGGGGDTGGDAQGSIV